MTDQLRPVRRRTDLLTADSSLPAASAIGLKDETEKIEAVDRHKVLSAILHLLP